MIFSNFSTENWIAIQFSDVGDSYPRATRDPAKVVFIPVYAAGVRATVRLSSVASVRAISSRSGRDWSQWVTDRYYSIVVSTCDINVQQYSQKVPTSSTSKPPTSTITFIFFEDKSSIPDHVKHLLNLVKAIVGTFKKDKSGYYS